MGRMRAGPQSGAGSPGKGNPCRIPHAHAIPCPGPGGGDGVVGSRSAAERRAGVRLHVGCGDRSDSGQENGQVRCHGLPGDPPRRALARVLPPRLAALRQRRGVDLAEARGVRKRGSGHAGGPPHVPSAHAERRPRVDRPTCDNLRQSAARSAFILAAISGARAVRSIVLEAP